MDRTLELLNRKLALKEAELATYSEPNFTVWLEKQYAEIDAELAKLKEEL
jgi:hypothetical protein